MCSRKIAPGHSNDRNDREDRNRKQKHKSHGNGTRSDDASSDSSSSLERGRKEKDTGAKKKEQIQGNYLFIILCRNVLLLLLQNIYFLIILPFENKIA